MNKKEKPTILGKRVKPVDSKNVHLNINFFTFINDVEFQQKLLPTLLEYHWKDIEIEEYNYPIELIRDFFIVEYTCYFKQLVIAGAYQSITLAGTQKNEPKDKKEV